MAGLIMPALAAEHSVRVFDLKPPGRADLEYVQGNVCDLEALRAACHGRDVLLYMAMGAQDWRSTHGITSALDANAKGVYLALHAAHDAGISHAVYTSSMSVYDGDLLARRFPDEDLPPDAVELYGFTKRMGEEACRAAARGWGMSVNALRLCLPIPDQNWLDQTREGVPTIATSASDTARAVLAAIAWRPPGFQAFTISGDYRQTSMNMSRARRYLDWEPLFRPVK